MKSLEELEKEFAAGLFNLMRKKAVIMSRFQKLQDQKEIFMLQNKITDEPRDKNK